MRSDVFDRTPRPAPKGLRADRTWCSQQHVRSLDEVEQLRRLLKHAVNEWAERRLEPTLQPGCRHQHLRSGRGSLPGMAKEAKAVRIRVLTAEHDEVCGSLEDPAERCREL